MMMIKLWLTDDKIWKRGWEGAKYKEDIDNDDDDDDEDIDDHDGDEDIDEDD